MGVPGKYFRLWVIALAGIAPAAVSGPAAAETIFEQIFGGIGRALEQMVRPPREDSYPSGPIAPPFPAHHDAAAPAFCVRTCDGHYFPVRGNANASTADMCHAFCPAAETRLFYGRKIDGAVAGDGSRYADLDKAFLFRRQLVAGCTCNGRSELGLAHIDAGGDPTLRPGDVVATAGGLVAYNGDRDAHGAFTPVESYPGFPKAYRDELARMKVAPTHPGGARDVTSSIVPAGQSASPATNASGRAK